MTSTVKNIKVGNTSYPVQDTRATPFLSSADEATLLSNGIYRGETVANGTVFTKPDGTLNEYSATPISPTWVSNATFQNANLQAYNGNTIVTLPGSNTRYVQVSTDGGSTWTQREAVSSTYASNQGMGLCFHKGYFYVLGRWSFSSSPDGITWTLLKSGDGQSAAYDTKLGGYLLSNGTTMVRLNTGLPYYYDEDSAAWVQASSSSSVWATSGTVDPITKIYYAAGNTGGVVLKSSDGKTWTTTTRPTTSDVTVAAYNDLVLAASDSAVYYSVDGGSTWTQSFATNSGNVRVLDGVFIIYVSGETKNYISTDGYTWTAVSGGYVSTNTIVTYNGNFRGNARHLPTTLQYDYTVTPLSYTKPEVNTALGEKQDTLTAGTGITIAETTVLSPSVTVVGTPTMTADGVASGFSDENYYSVDNMISSATRSFEIVTAVNMTTAADNVLGIFDSTQQSSTRIGLRLTTSATNTARLRVSTDGSTTFPVDITGTTPLTVGTKIWIKVTYNSTTGYVLYTSTDGSTWTTEGTSSTTTVPYANDGFYIGDNIATGLSLTGSIYMLDTYTKVDDVINWRAAEVANVISSTGGGGGSSYTAGTGIAIDSNNVISNTGLINTATGGNSLTIEGTPTTQSQSTNIGRGSVSNGTNSVVVGTNASSGSNYSVAIGGGPTTATAASVMTGSTESVAIGYNSHANAVNSTVIGRGSSSTGSHSTAVGAASGSTGTHGTAFGYDSHATNTCAIAVGSNTQATGTYSVAIGQDARATASGAIALGLGCRNSTARSLKVALKSTEGAGTDDVNQFILLNSSGKVPTGRYIPLTGATASTAGTTGSVPAPAAGDNAKFLRGDGTWADAGGGGSSYTAGDGISISNNVISLTTPYEVVQTLPASPTTGKIYFVTGS